MRYSCSSQLGRRRGGDRVAVGVFGVVGERDAAGAGERLVGRVAGHLERHDPLGVAERASVVRPLVDARHLDADPVVVVVVLRAARPGRRRGRAVERGQRARVRAFGRARVVGVEVVAHADQPRVHFRRERHGQPRHVGHADGRRERLRERPQIRERFARVQPRAGDVVVALHRFERAQGARGVAVQHRLPRLLGLGLGRRAARERRAARMRERARDGRWIGRSARRARARCDRARASSPPRRSCSPPRRASRRPRAPPARRTAPRGAIAPGDCAARGVRVDLAIGDVMRQLAQQTSRVIRFGIRMPGAGGLHHGGARDGRRDGRRIASPGRRRLLQRPAGRAAGTGARASSRAACARRSSDCCSRTPTSSAGRRAGAADDDARDDLRGACALTADARVGRRDRGSCGGRHGDPARGAGRARDGRELARARRVSSASRRRDSCARGRAWARQSSRAALDVRRLPARCDAIVLSSAERDSCARLLGGSAMTGAAPAGAIVAVTDAAGPTELLLPGGERVRVPVAAIAHPRDELGAGDVFAAAFFVALADGAAPAAAATFANAAAAVRMAGDGAGGDRRPCGDRGANGGDVERGGGVARRRRGCSALPRERGVEQPRQLVARRARRHARMRAPQAAGCRRPAPSRRPPRARAARRRGRSRRSDRRRSRRRETRCRSARPGTPRSPPPSPVWPIDGDDLRRELAAPRAYSSYATASPRSASLHVCTANAAISPLVSGFA